MKVYKGKQIVGKYFNVDLLIDFNDLFRFGGARYLIGQTSKSIARILLLVSLILLISGAYFIYSEENLELIITPENITHVFPSLSLFLALYAWYLLRDKQKFNFQFESLNLHKIRSKLLAGNIRKLEIENYYIEEVLGLIDFCYHKDSSRFLYNLSIRVLEDERAKHMLERRLGVNPSKFLNDVSVHLNTIDTSFDNNYQQFFLRNFGILVGLDIGYVDFEVLLLSLAKYYWKETLKDFEINDLEIEGILRWIKIKKQKILYYEAWSVYSKIKPRGAINRAYTSRATPTIDKYADDLTSLAARGRFEISIGKDQQLEETLKAISRDYGAAVLIVSEPGVGKSHLIKHIATKMVVEDVPEVLKDTRLISLNLSKIFARLSSIDEFKNVLQNIFEEIYNSKNIVTVFEDIGNLFELRSDARGELVSLISNAIDKRALRIIATSSQTAYSRSLKNAKGFISLFEPIELPEPPNYISFQILMDFVPQLESKYKVSINTDAVKRIIEVADYVYHERYMPDKGIVLLEESIVNAKAKGYKYVDRQIVDELISKDIGVKVGKLSEVEKVKLSNLEDLMHNQVVGQHEAINAVAAALRRSRAGIVSKKRPVASFLFYGPTGVGKTQVAKTLAEIYYGSKDLMIRIDMSEYQEESNLARLIGFTDENGNFQGGYLTEAVRTKPFSLILFDELEKANPKVLDLFLQILDEGKLRDGQGREVDFTHAIIITTSNVGSNKIAEFITQNKNYAEVKRLTEPYLSQVFRVEFLNRFDKVVMFNYLTQIEIEQIAELQIKDLAGRLEEKGILLQWDSLTLKMLAKEGYDPIYGARALRRLVQDKIETQLADKMIAGEIKSGNTVVFNGLELNTILM